jgi:hypothetical protein
MTCAVLRIDKNAMMEALHREYELSKMFVAYLYGEQHSLRRWISFLNQAKSG